MPHTELIARAIILRRGHVLLCQNLESGYFYLPGGHVEFGETVADAVTRELMEETGARVRVGACVSVDEHIFTQRGRGKAGKRRARHEINVLVRADLGGSRASMPPVRSLEPHIGFSWVAVGDLGSVDLRPGHHTDEVVRAAGRTIATVFRSSTP